MKKILMGLGFSYDDYPDIESEYYNFDSLNTPAWHPARDLHDTFYVGQGQLLRTHTTAFQARVMRASEGRVPIRAMTTGRCYRADDIDASHYPIFQQLDVFAVGSKLSMSDLRWTLTNWPKACSARKPNCVFAPAIFRPRRPAEVDISCVVCKQKGCALCSRTWLARSFRQKRHDAAGSAARADLIRKHQGSRSASASTASPCCGTRSMTSACSTTTRKLSCASSELVSES
jgi:phenylalanyl-tRNA synthetase alpha chain